jgi:hypothetical protein
VSKGREELQLFRDSVATATGYPPDGYPERHPGWVFHRQELLTDWAAAKLLIKQDLHHVATINDKLNQAIASFDRGDREPGQSLMVEIYNVLNLNDLR